MLKDLEHLIMLSRKYNVPTEDLLLLDLNLSGIKLNLESGRVRFELEVSEIGKIFSYARENNIKNFYLAVPTVENSYYHFKENNLYFKDEIIGKAHGMTDDYCDRSYPRRGGTVLNINPNSRTSCKGCKFCYTDLQIPRDEERLLSYKKLQEFFINWIEKFEINDLSHLLQVAVVTGCFSCEQDVVDFLKLLKHVLNEFNFKGELLYFGSQIHDKKALDELESVKPFAICATIECFENRRFFLRNNKYNVSLEEIKEMLSIASDRNIRTNFSYIAGLESLKILEDGFSEFFPYINSFPIVNVFQIHRGQDGIECYDARKIEYFIKARKCIENIFIESDLRPRPWENYRSLWYIKFSDELLSDIRTPLTSPDHVMFNEIVACARPTTREQI